MQAQGIYTFVQRRHTYTFSYPSYNKNMEEKQNYSNYKLDPIKIKAKMDEILKKLGKPGSLLTPRKEHQEKEPPQHSLKSRFHENGHISFNEFNMAKLIIQLGILNCDIETFIDEEKVEFEDMITEVDLLPLLLSSLIRNGIDVTSTVELQKAVKEFAEMNKVDYHKLLQVTCLPCARKYVKDVFEGTSAKADIDLLNSITNIDTDLMMGKAIPDKRSSVDRMDTTIPDKDSSVDPMEITHTSKFKMELNMSGTYQPIERESWGCQEDVLGFSFRWPASLIADKVFKCDQKVTHVPGESFLCQSKTRGPFWDVSLSDVPSKKYFITPPFVWETISVETHEPCWPTEPYGVIQLIVCLLSMKEVDELVKQGLIPPPGLHQIIQRKLIKGTLENTKICFRWHIGLQGRMHYQARYVRPDGELCGERWMYLVMKKA